MMKVMCSFCKERSDIHSSDGDFHQCYVCHLEHLLMMDYFRPKIRQVAIDIIDKQLLKGY